jgi:hypothetical protein
MKELYKIPSNISQDKKEKLSKIEPLKTIGGYGVLRMLLYMMGHSNYQMQMIKPY